MQSILSSVILAIVAGAAVDSAAVLRSKSVAKRDLWHYGGTQNHQELQIQGRSMEWNHHGGDGGGDDRQLSSDNYHFDHLRVPVHPVHEWPQEESHDKRDQWSPVYHEPKQQYAVSSHSKESSKEQHSQKEWRDDEDDDDKHDEPEKHDGHHHIHHHHHHVKVIEVPKPYTVHVEKPYPVYVEKPVIVEKHVPLKLYIKKKIH